MCEYIANLHWRNFKASVMILKEKICSKCKIKKPLTAFRKDKKKEDGHHIWCKECCSIYDKQRYKNNKEKMNKQSKQYYLDNKEKINEQSRQYYIDNKEKMNEQARQYHIDNKKEISKNKKEYYNNNKKEILNKRKQYYIDNTEEVKEKVKQYGKDNPEKKAAIEAKWRALKKNQTPDLTKEEQERVRRLYEIRDLLNHDKIDFHVDHIQPLSKGGLHHPDNLQILPNWLNGEKSKKWPLTESEQIKYEGFRL